MVADALLKEYSIVRMEFQNTHSAGTLISYDHPCIGFLKKGTGIISLQRHDVFCRSGRPGIYCQGHKILFRMVWHAGDCILFHQL